MTKTNHVGENRRVVFNLFTTIRGNTGLIEYFKYESSGVTHGIRIMYLLYCDQFLKPFYVF